MRQNKNTNDSDNAIGNKPQKGTKARYASKKAYFARNKDGAITKRHKATRAARAKRRATYWASPAGQERLNAKLNTPEKIRARELSRKARDVRRRERKLAEQKAKEVETVAAPPSNYL